MTAGRNYSAGAITPGYGIAIDDVGGVAKIHADFSDTAPSDSSATASAGVSLKVSRADHAHADKITASVLFASGYGTIAAYTSVGKFTSGGNSGKVGPSAATTVSGSHSSGVTTINVASTAGFTVGDVLQVGTGMSAENVTIATIVNATSFTCLATSNAHSNGDTVVMTDGRQAAIGYTAASTNTTGGVTASVIVSGLLTDSALTRHGVTPSREVSMGNDLVWLP